MMYAVQMSLFGMIFLLSVINIGTGVNIKVSFHKFEWL
jgi:hypothetical protein